jgi:hypothetical protein
MEATVEGRLPQFVRLLDIAAPSVLMLGVLCWVKNSFSYLVFRQTLIFRLNLQFTFAVCGLNIHTNDLLSRADTASESVCFS